MNLKSYAPVQAVAMELKKHAIMKIYFTYTLIDKPTHS